MGTNDLNEGPCVGGPYDGFSYARPGKTLEVYRLDSMPTDARACDTPVGGVREGEYRWDGHRWRWHGTNRYVGRCVGGPLDTAVKESTSPLIPLWDDDKHLGGYTWDSGAWRWRSA